MKAITRIRVFSVLVLAVLFVQGAGAATITYLPESSHYQGRSYFRGITDDGILLGRIEFAVYDTQDGDEFAQAGYTAPGTGRYTYVYHVFNDDPDSTDELDYFAVLGIGAGAFADPVGENIGWVDDTEGGREPTAWYLAPSLEKAVWEFEGGFLDDHSFFLILSSDHDFTVGSYSVVRGIDPEMPIPNPEPSTVALLGVGGVLALIRRKRRVT